MRPWRFRPVDFAPPGFGIKAKLGKPGSGAGSHFAPPGFGIKAKQTVIWSRAKLSTFVPRPVLRHNFCFYFPDNFKQISPKIVSI